MTAKQWKCVENLHVYITQASVLLIAVMVLCEVFDYSAPAPMAYLYLSITALYGITIAIVATIRGELARRREQMEHNDEQ